MPRYDDPGFCHSLKEARYWSMDWIAENGIQGPFEYVVLLKSDNGYKVMGQYATASEAFDDRRRLVEETGTRSYFLRAVRVYPIDTCEVIGPGHPESKEDLDRWRDALSTGDESLVPEAELAAFRSWAAQTIENRPAYQRVDRDAPRFAGAHGEIPF